MNTGMIQADPVLEFGTAIVVTMVNSASEAISLLRRGSEDMNWSSFPLRLR